MTILYLKTETDDYNFKRNNKLIFNKKTIQNNHKRNKNLRTKTEQNKRINKCKYLIKHRSLADRSPMEKEIELILMKNEVDFIAEKWAGNMFNDRTNNLLFFDFFLPKYKAAIEFDGIHHFKPIYGIDALKQQKHKDKRKNLFCAKHGIKILRISCFNSKDAEKIICNFFDNHF